MRGAKGKNVNQADRQHDESDELRDRLVEQGLREILGGEQPPDLSQQITSALPATGPEREVMIMKRNRVHRLVLSLAALAASVLLLASLMLPATQSSREAARSRLVVNETSNYVPEPQTQALERRYVNVELKSEQNKEAKVAKEWGYAGDANAKGQFVEFDASAPGNPSQSADASGGLNRGRVTYAGKALAPTSGPVREIRLSGSSTAPQLTVKGGTVLESDTFPVQPWAVQLTEESEPRPLPRHDADDGLGRGPADPGDQYARIHDNPFLLAQGAAAVSTFSIDVDTASYTNVRQFLLQSNRLPPPDAVRIEELINYFDYDYAPPADETPFASHVEVAGCPWQPEHRLVRIALKGREMPADERPLSNLVFLVDVSGSMNQQNKLPLVVDGLKYLTRELGENDRVAIVVYASAEGLALPSTPGTEQEAILSTLSNLAAGGSTAGGAGIKLAYQVAEDNFIEGGTNRVILCTDGDFNVGVTSTAELERMAEEKAKGTGVFLTVLGFGRGNLNDAMMETISNKGNGNYHYVDNLREAHRVLVEQMTGTLVTIAKDVKIQVEFNPTKVAGYRLIGYENRMLAREDFNDDTKDAGEIGAGHTVTAVYQVVPAGKPVATGSKEPLKYQQEPAHLSAAAASDELLTVRVRYKPPASDTSTKLEFPVKDSDASYANASDDFKFAAAVASFGMLLRDSEYRGNATYNAVLELATEGLGQDGHGYRMSSWKW